MFFFFFFLKEEDGIRDKLVTGVQTCALPICPGAGARQRLGGELPPEGDAVSNPGGESKAWVVDDSMRGTWRNVEAVKEVELHHRRVRDPATTHVGPTVEERLPPKRRCGQRDCGEHSERGMIHETPPCRIDLALQFRIP